MEDPGLAGLEPLAFLSDSTARWRTLRALAEGPQPFGDLRAELATPQSTLNRNLTKLAETGWVREEPARTFRLTAVGEGLVAELAAVEGGMSVFAALADHPDAFPYDAFDFDLARLAAASVLTTDEGDPMAVVTRVRDLLGDASVVHGFRPIFMPAYIDVSSRIAHKEDGEILGMVPSHQLDAALADDDFDMGSFPDVDTVEFRVWDGDTDYALAVIDDDVVVLTGNHEGGIPDVLVESRDPAVRAWAQSEIERIRDLSDPVSERV